MVKYQGPQRISQCGIKSVPEQLSMNSPMRIAQIYFCNLLQRIWRIGIINGKENSLILCIVDTEVFLTGAACLKSRNSWGQTQISFRHYRQLQVGQAAYGNDIMKVPGFKSGIFIRIYNSDPESGYLQVADCWDTFRCDINFISGIIHG